LTPQKFKTLIQQVLDLNIDTEQRLKGCIDIIFEKVKILTVNFDKFAHYVIVKYGHEVYLLWSPYGIGQTIVFSSCGFFLSSICFFFS